MVVIDNCLPVSWVYFLQQNGQPARHWREIGAPNAPDIQILQWAMEHDAVVFTHDLDFTKLLFQSRSALPSVIQLRVDDVRPENVGKEVVLILKRYQQDLRSGALITINANKSRLRILPLRS
jgi:predicted nuclease of predicted toxin-antitoxin system